MAHIEYPLEVLEEFMSLGNPWAEKLYKEKKAYLDSLKSKTKPKAQKEKAKTKSKKETPAEKLYRELMEDPKITKISKEQLKRNTLDGSKLDYEYLKAFQDVEMMQRENWDSDEEEEKPKPKTRGRPKKRETVEEKPVIIKTPKTYKTGNIMKGRSDLIKMKTGKYAVDTEINLKKGLDPKVTRALKKAVDQELDKRIKGGRIIDLDYSSDSTDSESSSDEEDTKEYKKILKHLLSHVKDKKEKKDPRDIRDIKGIMKRLKAKSR